jgi:hypothetical protein
MVYNEKKRKETAENVFYLQWRRLPKLRIQQRGQKQRMQEEGKQ